MMFEVQRLANGRLRAVVITLPRGKPFLLRREDIADLLTHLQPDLIYNSGTFELIDEPGEHINQSVNHDTERLHQCHTESARPRP